MAVYQRLYTQNSLKISLAELYSYGPLLHEDVPHSHVENVRSVFIHGYQKISLLSADDLNGVDVLSEKSVVDTYTRTPRALSLQTAIL